MTYKLQINLITITRLTRETALSGISHRYMIPNISTVIMLIVKQTNKADTKSSPSSTKVTPKIAARDTTV